MRKCADFKALSFFVALFLCAAAPCAVSSQANCPQAMGAENERGWQLYRTGDIPGAKAAFERALAICPNEPSTLTGLAYVDLRNNDVTSAKKRLDIALVKTPRDIDALIGRGIVAWREGDTARVRSAFERVQAIEPKNEEARTYLARIPKRDVAVVRPPLVVPQTTQYWTRANGNRFEVRTASGWRPFYIKGMNLGAALPGKYPSEFPDSATYARWLTQMGAMGVNTVRVYTIHPPHFYAALAAYNKTHATAPIWLMHGVWTELPPEGDFDDKPWKNQFFQEMNYVVDLLHGRADIPARAGHASGHYTADVSRWVFGYIIGREWEPFAIAQFNSKSKRNSYHGKYLDVASGSPSDVWMGEACETMIAYEMKTYRAQHPIAYTNWPTLDPMHHPTETTVEEEVAIRRFNGENVTVQPKEYNNDEFGLDATLIHPTSALPAGWFASYHAYPYYPDFMSYDTAYSKAASSEGTSNYYGYLKDLKAHHPNIPVVISEYGVPSSIGIAHFQAQGWYHGGVSEEEMARTDARMTREIAEAGMAGGIVFAWIDEWFKKNWITIDYEIPLDRTKNWHNRMDAEQHYGMYAMEAKPPVSGATLRDRLPDWRRIKPLYEGSGAGTLRAAADASYLWLLYEPSGEKPRDLQIGFDILDPDRGDKRWPDRAGAPLPVGLEFVLHIHGDTAQLIADSAANPWVLARTGVPRLARAAESHLHPDVPGVFKDRLEMQMNHSVGSVANADGAYSPLLVIPNRRRFTRDSSEIIATGYDRGVLAKGEPADGLRETLDDGTVEVRIPWMLLNFTDPSQRRVLDNLGSKDLSDLATSVVDGIRIVGRITNSAGDVRTWPLTNERGAVASFTWQTWEDPQWVSRERPVYSMMRQTFAGLKPAENR